MLRIRMIFGFAAASAMAMAGPSKVQADPIKATYSTTGSISTSGMSGTPDITFQGVPSGTLTTGQPFNLGEFVASSPDGGAAPTYGMTPFQITVTFTGSNGDPSLPKQAPITLSGELDTSVSGSSLGPNVAAFLATAPPTPGASILNAYTQWFSDGGAYSYGIHPTQTEITLAPTSQNGGVFEVQAQIDAYHAPEASTLATLVAAVAGVFLKARYRCFRELNRGSVKD